MNRLAHPGRSPRSWSCSCWLQRHPLHRAADRSRRWSPSSASRCGSITEPGLHAEDALRAERRSASTGGCWTTSAGRGGDPAATSGGWSWTPSPRYRIVDPLLFFQTVGAERGRHARPAQLDRLRLAAPRAGQRAPCSPCCRPTAPGSWPTIREQVNKESAGFGVEVMDVRIRRADLPEENTQAILRRMQSEREREARQARAEGAEACAAHPRRRRARPHRAAGRGQRQAEILRGQGEAAGDRIYRRAPSSRTRNSSTSGARCRPIARPSGDGDARSC